jgi:putative membrane protein
MKYPIALLHIGAQISWTRYTVHWSTVIGLAVLGALYIWRANLSRSERGSRLHWTKPAMFFAGLALMFFSLNGWIHDLSDSYLFSAHMVQHLFLAMGVAPLLIMGTPAWMLRPLLRYRLVAAVSRPLGSAIACFLIFNVVLIGWHLPPLYNAAMSYHEIHIVQHLLLLSASVIMWWPVLSPMAEFPRISYPAQMLYLFLMTIPMSVVSVAIAYSSSILYPAYASAPRVLRLSPMEDQMLGGLIMWIPGGLFFFAIISVVFYRWQKSGGLDSRASAQVDYLSQSGGRALGNSAGSTT